MIIVIGHHYIVGVLLFMFDLYSHIDVWIFVNLWWWVSYFKVFFFRCDEHLREICLQRSSSLTCIDDISFLLLKYRSWNFIHFKKSVIFLWTEFLILPAFSSSLRYLLWHSHYLLLVRWSWRWMYCYWYLSLFLSHSRSCQFISS